MSNDPHKLRDKTDHELYIWIAGWKPNSEWYIAGQQELKRRNENSSELRGWIAIAISGFALIVSVVALSLSL
jgi:hypothetical protein